MAMCQPMDAVITATPPRVISDRPASYLLGISTGGSFASPMTSALNFAFSSLSLAARKVSDSRCNGVDSMFADMGRTIDCLWWLLPSLFFLGPFSCHRQLARLWTRPVGCRQRVRQTTREILARAQDEQDSRLELLLRTMLSSGLGQSDADD